MHIILQHSYLKKKEKNYSEKLKRIPFILLIAWDSQINSLRSHICMWESHLNSIRSHENTDEISWDLCIQRISWFLINISVRSHWDLREIHNLHWDHLYENSYEIKTWEVTRIRQKFFQKLIWTRRIIRLKLTKRHEI